MLFRTEAYGPLRDAWQRLSRASGKGSIIRGIHSPTIALLDIMTESSLQGSCLAEVTGTVGSAVRGAAVHVYLDVPKMLPDF